MQDFWSFNGISRLSDLTSISQTLCAAAIIEFSSLTVTLQMTMKYITPSESVAAFVTCIRPFSRVCTPYQSAKTQSGVGVNESATGLLVRADCELTGTLMPLHMFSLRKCPRTEATFAQVGHGDAARCVLFR